MTVADRPCTLAQRLRGSDIADAPPVRSAQFVAALLFLTCSACTQNSAAPSSTTTPTIAPATVTETFSGTLPVSGSRFYSFGVPVYGTVSATLTGMAGAGVPDSVVVNLGVGTPAGTTCSATPTQVQLTGDANLTTQVTATEQPGVYCAIVSDFGNLAAPATFTIAISHP